MTFAPGQRVEVCIGDSPAELGTVRSQVMAPPDYTQAAAVSVLLDSELHRYGYAGTMLPARDVRPAAVCTSCGRETAVCCDASNDGRGRHVDAVCAACCGPHPPGRPPGSLVLGGPA
jgi:hypothetical protein